jgi:hypothetical protein
MEGIDAIERKLGGAGTAVDPAAPFHAHRSESLQEEPIVKRVVTPIVVALLSFVVTLTACAIVHLGRAKPTWCCATARS